MVTAFGVAYMTSAGGLSPSTTFVLFLFAQLVGIVGALSGGRVADRLGARNTMLCGLVVLAVAFVPLFPLARTGNVVLLALCTAGVVASCVFILAAQASFYAYAFPVRMRYFGSSIAYAATNTLFGGTGAVVATWLLSLSGVGAVTAYGVVLVVASFLAVLARPARPTPFPESGVEAQR
jgi:predicted MFS family arabinose efflux permease